MIRVRKGAAPRKLTRDGPAKAGAHAVEFGTDPAAFAAGTRRFKFAVGVYAHASVQEALAQAQSWKCCYCESKPERPYAFLHVEHWRPKSSVKQAPGASPLRPAYFWLAYDWDNLFLACHFCNSSNKGDLFPLADEAVRARAPGDDLSSEEPFLLKPDGPDDPRDHITFHEEVPVGTTPKGRMTVEVLGLAKTEHVPRLRLLDLLRKSRAVAMKYHGDPNPAAVEFVAQARGILQAAALPEAPFSAMAATFLELNPLPD